MVELDVEHTIPVSLPFMFVKDLPWDIVLILICPLLPSRNNIKDAFLL